ncbi:MAG: TetR/AcrR family transcriptional regulator [Clostridiales Family XIII bacterium]|nr:TetR/AcrR family transcriptional regulator [Clostridiales Family XIII bacterium]
MDARASITNAMYQLIQKYPMERITVDMIIRESDTSRSTFYRYFEDKYQLLSQFYEDFAFDLFHYDNWYSVLFEIHTFFKANQSFFSHAFIVEGQYSYKKFMMNHGYRLASELYRRNNENAELSFEETEALHHYVAGGFHLTSRWIERGMDISVACHSELLCSCVPKILSKRI